MEQLNSKSTLTKFYVRRQQQLSIILLFAIALLFSCKPTEEFVPKILIPITEYNVNASENSVEVVVAYNADYEIIIDQADDWISVVTTKALNAEAVTLLCQPNGTIEERSAVVEFKIANYDVFESIIITQHANQKPEIKSIAIRAKNNTEIIEDYLVEIKETGTVNIVIPYILTSKLLVVEIEHTGTFTSLDVSNPIDFSNPVEIAVKDDFDNENTYTINLSYYTGIPTLHINTEGSEPITSKDVYLKGDVKLAGNGVVPSLAETSMRIKGRGNSTWSWPKKPYKIKFDSKVSMAGFPADKEWVLLANYIDPGMLRNATAFKIGEILGMEWSNRSCLVDLYLNNEYQGCYLLCEQVKIAKNRVNITDLKDSDIEEPNVTGGYLLELDTYYDEDRRFRSSIKNFPVMIKEPDLNDVQFEWIKNHFNIVEDVMYSSHFDDPIIGYRAYIEPDAFIKWWLVYELMGNPEPNHPKSSYMYKDREGKFKMGPIWDFDYGTCRRTDQFYINTALWYDKLFIDPVFVAEVKTLWNEIRLKLDSQLNNFIANEIERTKHSINLNVKKWGVPKYETWTPGTIEEEIQQVQDYFIARISWLDTAINGL